ncbi:hypothetical protein V8G54_006065 [Vigna mungo]|uniref:Post-SET domain-containing protein n=1 Tax=Vigna mungo TaxID=3915 RepID=A0AAQ3P2K0_VIGMU
MPCLGMKLNQSAIGWGETQIGAYLFSETSNNRDLMLSGYWLCRFVQFGPEVKCNCGAANCQGFLGTKKKIGKLDFCWGSKRKRTSSNACITLGSGCKKRWEKEYLKYSVPLLGFFSALSSRSRLAVVLLSSRSRLAQIDHCFVSSSIVVPLCALKPSRSRLTKTFPLLVIFLECPFCVLCGVCVCGFGLRVVEELSQIRKNYVKYWILDNENIRIFDALDEYGLL